MPTVDQHIEQYRARVQSERHKSEDEPARVDKEAELLSTLAPDVKRAKKLLIVKQSEQDQQRRQNRFAIAADDDGSVARPAQEWGELGDADADAWADADATASVAREARQLARQANRQQRTAAHSTVNLG